MERSKSALTVSLSQIEVLTEPGEIVTTRIPLAAACSEGSRAAESVTTTTGTASAHALVVRHSGLRECGEHQRCDRLVRLEVPVDTVGIAATGKHLIGDGLLEIVRVQPAGKPAMSAADWLRGRGGSGVLA